MYGNSCGFSHDKDTAMCAIEIDDIYSEVAM